jgi:hypothetical protein
VNDDHEPDEDKERYSVDDYLVNIRHKLIDPCNDACNSKLQPQDFRLWDDGLQERASGSSEAGSYEGGASEPN